MASKFVNYTALVLAALVFRTTVNACDNGFLPLNSLCINIIDASVNYATAKYICEKVHIGSLYRPKDAGDLKLLHGIATYGYGVKHDLWLGESNESQPCTALGQISKTFEVQSCEKENGFVCKRTSKEKSTPGFMDKQAFERNGALELRLSKLEDTVQKLEVEVAIAKTAAMKCDSRIEVKFADSSPSGNLSIYTPRNARCASPPVVYPLPKDRNVVVSLNQNVELSCTAYGYPIPEVRWQLPKEVTPNEVNTTRTNVSVTSRLSVYEAKPNHSGNYSCFVDNRVGPQQAIQFTVDILHKASTAAIMNVIQTGSLQHIKLQCVVNGLPQPTVTWMKSGTSLEQNATVKVLNATSIISTISLFISDTSKDLGVYSCFAKNSLGESASEILVKGAPPFGVAVANLTELGPGKFQLVLMASSYCTIEEYRVKFKSNDDLFYMYAPIAASSPFTAGNIVYTETFELPARHGRLYEVWLEAKNEFGWNASKSAFNFNSTYVCGAKVIAEEKWRFIESSEFYEKPRIVPEGECKTDIASPGGLEIQFTKFDRVHYNYCVRLASQTHTEQVCGLETLRLPGSKFELKETKTPLSSEGFLARFRKISNK